MNLPRHISQRKMKKGFTLIELLIVIGILGILAAGLLAAIDPLEQLRRGRDTNRRNIALEANNAMLRYYAVQGSMPWGTAATNFTLISGLGTGVIGTLVTAGELKTTFQTGISNIGQLNVVAEASAASVGVCFDPESKSISQDPSTIYVTTGGTSLQTTTQAYCASNVCWFCVK